MYWALPPKPGSVGSSLNKKNCIDSSIIEINFGSKKQEDYIQLPKFYVFLDCASQWFRADIQIDDAGWK